MLLNCGEDSTVSTTRDNFNNVTVFTYDNHKNLVSTSFSDGNIEITRVNAYTDDKISSKTDEFNNSVSYSYDNQSRINEITYPNLLVINSSYNNIDKITEVSSSTLENNLSYLNKI